MIKTVVLDSLALGFDRAKAAEAAGLSMRALRLLLLRDSSFRADVAALRSADDDSLADQARRNIHRFLDDGDRTVTLHVDRTRGGYNHATRGKAGEPDEIPDPIDRTQFDGERTPDILSTNGSRPDHGPVPGEGVDEVPASAEEMF